MGEPTVARSGPRQAAQTTAGVLAAGLAFDLVSWRAETAYVYTRGAWLLMALSAVMVAATSAAVGWRRWSRNRFDLWLWPLVVALSLASLSWLLRERAGFAFHDAAPRSATLVTAGALAFALLAGLSSYRSRPR